MRISALAMNTTQNNSFNRTSSLYNVNNEKECKEGSSLKLANPNQNKVMENLENLKKNFLEQKQALRDVEMDPKEKRYKIEEINENIQQIEAQIQQLSIQQREEELAKMKEEMEKKKAEEEKNNTNGDEVRDGVIISASLNELIQASHSLDNIHNLKDIKNREKIEAMYIGPTDNPNSYNSKRLAQINKSAVNADMNISKEIGKINNSAEKIQDKVTSRVEELKENDEKEKEKDEEHKVE